MNEMQRRGVEHIVATCGWLVLVCVVILLVAVAISRKEK